MLCCTVQCEICRKIIRKLLFETNDAHQRKIMHHQHAHCTKNTLNLWHLCIYDCLTNIVIINIKQVLPLYKESERRRRKNAHTHAMKRNSDVRLISFIWCISCVDVSSSFRIKRFQHSNRTERTSFDGIARFGVFDLRHTQNRNSFSVSSNNMSLYRQLSMFNCTYYTCSTALAWWSNCRWLSVVLNIWWVLFESRCSSHLFCCCCYNCSFPHLIPLAEMHSYRL